MNNQAERASSDPTESMIAKIEIDRAGDPTFEKEVTDRVTALEGVTDAKVEKGALHVSYDVLATTEKKIEQAVQSAGGKVKDVDVDTERPRPGVGDVTALEAPQPKNS
jgi:hypothetical protein